MDMVRTASDPEIERVLYEFRQEIRRDPRGLRAVSRIFRPLEDLGRIPTVADWLGRIQPEPWMLAKGQPLPEKPEDSQGCDYIPLAFRMSANPSSSV